MPNPMPERDEGLLVEERATTKEPPLFRVLLHNDDYTTMPFVVYVLQHIFHHSEAEAMRIMLNVHRRGLGVAGVYPHEVAETKMMQTIQLARANEFPLLCTIEPTD